MATSGNKKKHGFLGRIFSAPEEYIITPPDLVEDDAILAGSDSTDILPEDTDPSYLSDMSDMLDLSEIDEQEELLAAEEAERQRALLLAEEADKQRAATMAKQAAAAAEDAREKAEYDYQIKQASELVGQLTEQSAVLQKEAMAALATLSETEKEYKKAVAATQKAALEEREVREKAEKEIAYISEINEATNTVANENLEKLAKTLEEKRVAAAEAITEGKKAEAMLTEANQVWEQIRQEKLAAVNAAKAKAEHVHNEIESLENDINAQSVIFETKIKTLKEEYDNSLKALHNVEKQYKQGHNNLEKFLDEDKRHRDKLNAELDAAIASFENKIAETDKARAEISFSIENTRKDKEMATAAVEAAEEESLSLQAQPKELHNEKSALLAAAKKETATNLQKIEAARKDVARKKDAYSQAQHRVEELTMASVQANAQLTVAKEKVNKASVERADAATAAEIAKKLKFDASAARENTDQESSILLSKAEMVLLNTSEQAQHLLEEKDAYLQMMEQDAERLRAEADIANAEARRAASNADAMIAEWLAADEALAKISIAVELANKKINDESIAAITMVEQKIVDIEKQKTLNGEALKKANKQKNSAENTLSKQEEKYAQLTQTLDQLTEQYYQSKTAIEDSLSKHEEEAEQAIKEYQEQLQHLEEDIAQLKYDVEAKQQTLASKNEEYDFNHQEQLQALSVKKDEAAALDADIASSEIEYNHAIKEIQARSEELSAFVYSCQKVSSELPAEVKQIEEAYEAAASEAEKVKLAGDAALINAKKAAEEALAPKREEVKVAEDQAMLCFELLNEMRQSTENVVKKAINLSIERIKAVNRLDTKMVEVETYALDKELEPVQAAFESAQAAFAEIEAEYNFQLKQTTALRAEEAEIVANTDQRYQEIEDEKQVELAAIDERIQKLADVEKTVMAEIEKAEKALKDLERAIAEKQLDLDNTTKDYQELQAEQQAKLDVLTEKYNQDINDETDQPHQLYDLYQQSEDRLEQANAVAQELEENLAAQQNLVSVLVEQEDLAAQEYSAVISEQKEISASSINDLQDALQELSDKKEELSNSQAKNDLDSEQTIAAHKEAEDNLQALLEEEEETRTTYESQLAAINERLKLLKEDADLKEQKFRDTEATLKNSTKLMLDADTALAEAKDNHAKAESEVYSAESTYKTSITLADQARQASQDGDNEIMRKAAQDLAQAANNAAVLLEEKKKVKAATEKELRLAELNAENMQRLIKEVPALTEEDKAVWVKALDEYNNYREIAEEKIPQLKKSFDTFARKQTKAIAAEKTNVEKCLSSKEKADRDKQELAQSLSNIIGEIQNKQAELANLQSNSKTQLADIEAKYQQQLAEKHKERLAAEALLTEIEADFAAAQAEQEEAQNIFVQAEATYSNNNDALMLARERITEQYNIERKEIEQIIKQARLQVDELELQLDSLFEEQKLAQNELSQLKVEYQKKVTAREKTLAERENIIVIKERLFTEAAEEKLKVMGYKTIARIAAEEELDKLKEKFAAKQRCLQQTKKIFDDLQALREAAKDKLSNIKEEGEQALDSAKTNMVDLLRKAI